MNRKKGPAVDLKEFLEKSPLSSSSSPAPVEKLTDDLLVEILTRVPYKSLIRSKCVSRHWLRVISHPDSRRRRRLPRYHLHNGIAGFFFHRDGRFFIDIAGEGRPSVDPSFPFLPKCDDLRLLDTCNGLLLCGCRMLSDPPRLDYLVLNPATQHSVVLPHSGGCGYNQRKQARLGFDPAVSSSHFHVFEFVEDRTMFQRLEGVAIYSSKTGVWTHRDPGWGCDVSIFCEPPSVFFNNMLHFFANDVVAAVDVEGDTWRLIPLPLTGEKGDPFIVSGNAFLDLSQGCLHFVDWDCDYEPSKVSVWVLEDYDSEKWTAKHLRHYLPVDGSLIAIHPERNIVFSVLQDKRVLVSHEMDTGEELHYPCETLCFARYLRYVPLHSESLADGH